MLETMTSGQMTNRTTLSQPFQRLASLGRAVLPKSALGQRLSSGIAWTLAGNLILKGFSAISAVGLAWILGPKGLGQYGMIQSTVAVFSVYAAFRMGNTAIKYVAENRLKDPARAARILRLTLTVSLLLCSVVGAGLFVLSPVVARSSLADSNLTVALRLGAFLILFSTYATILQQTLAGFEDFLSIAKVNILRGLLAPILILPLAWLWGVNGAIAGLALVAVLVIPRIVGYLRLNSRRFEFPRRVSLASLKAEMPILWTFALPGFMVLTLMTLAAWLSRLVLVRGQAGFSGLGMFEAANQWKTVVLILPMAISRVALPILCNSHGSGAKQDFRSAVSLQFQTVSMITLPLILLLVGLAKPLSQIYGTRFAQTEAVLPLILISVYFSAVNESIRIIYESLGRQWANLAIYAAWATVQLAGCWILVPKFGVFGFALALLLSDIALFLMQCAMADLVLAPGVLRREAAGVLRAAVLLASAYFTRSRFDPLTQGAVVAFLVLLACAPIFPRLRAAWSRG